LSSFAPGSLTTTVVTSVKARKPVDSQGSITTMSPAEKRSPFSSHSPLTMTVISVATL